MNIMKKFIDLYHQKISPNFVTEIEEEIRKSKCKSLLDVGCGANSPIQRFSDTLDAVGIDAFKPSINKSKLKKIHKKYYQMEVLQIGDKFKKKSFDCVLASDLIEHLTKKEGNKLINMMEKIAKKRVIIFTPNGFVPQGEYDSNPWQVHNSGWGVEEMRRRGYEIIGINGLKCLRGEYALVRWKPSLFWKIISNLSQLFTRNHPKFAFQILCIKEVNKKD